MPPFRISDLRYREQFDLEVNIEEFVLGSHKQVMIDTTDVAPWGRPIVKFNIPKGSRPGDKIRIRNALPTTGFSGGCDVHFILRLCCNSTFLIRGDDIFIELKVKRKRNRMVKTVRIPFPDGSIMDVEVNRVVNDRLCLVYSEMGMPCRNSDESITNDSKPGDFFVILKQKAL